MTAKMLKTTKSTHSSLLKIILFVPGTRDNCWCGLPEEYLYCLANECPSSHEQANTSSHEQGQDVILSSVYDYITEINVY